LKSNAIKTLIISLLLSLGLRTLKDKGFVVLILWHVTWVFSYNKTNEML